MPDHATIASITIDPEPAAWAGLLPRTPLDERSRMIRTQLGLPTDRPIIMTGHQPGFWHAGILAKYLAADAAARQLKATAAWLVVDQDDHDPTPIRVPVRGENGRLRAASWQSIDRASGVAKGVPIGAIPACPPQPPMQEVMDGKAALASVATGLGRMRELLGKHAGAASLARQFAGAAGDAISGLVSSVPFTAPVLYAMELARTNLFAWLVGRMIEDPIRCSQTYNDAARAFPEAGITPLRIPTGSDGSRVELPLWRIDRGSTSIPGQTHFPPTNPERKRAGPPNQAVPPLPDGRGSLTPNRAIAPAPTRLSATANTPLSERGGTQYTLPARLRVTANMLAALPREQLAPRALLMTAMLRLGACDLFIHGTGGGAYDRVTDQWIKEWLGETLAPTAVVTATMYLPLGAEPARAADAAKARWLAHRARHDPSLLGDEPAAREKAVLVEQLRADKRQGMETKGTYRALHALLARVREEQTERLHALDAHALQAKAQLADADVIGDRTWAFPLFDNSDLVRLRDEIDRRFGEAGVTR